MPVLTKPLALSVLLANQAALSALFLALEKPLGDVGEGASMVRCPTVSKVFSVLHKREWDSCW